MTDHITKEKLSTNSQDKDIVLSVKGVSKKFCRSLKRSLFYGVQDIAGELLGIRGEKNELRHKEFWALSDVSFDLRRGETIGLVGKNGSGKTTLLRIIAGLIKPDAGYVDVYGIVAPLIALGAGFNPILTGKENIYANMSILGLSKKEIDERFDEVIDFAEIEDAIDAPVQTYSSGMAARLGFASAIYTEPEILLVDEVLAVGDSKFRGKCFQKLHDLRQKGTTFLLVSHDSHTVLTVCERAVYLQKGELIEVGDTQSVITHYEKDLFLNVTESPSKNHPIKSINTNQQFAITSIFFRNEDDEIIDVPTTGEPTYLCVTCQVKETLTNVGLTFSIKGMAEGGDQVLLMNSLHDERSLSFSSGKQEVRLEMPYLGLKLGAYVLDVYAKRDGLYHLDSVEDYRFQVKATKSMNRCLFYQPRSWKVLQSYQDLKLNDEKTE
ncbi:putative ABC transporter, ATP binding protein [Crocosphaera subtropica ATCC 51142]|uniref:ABC transporter, ATP binding protein n=1 Tax=Crocosphaera subtropica (strain ATCC 51142 / BH68) TaxID=43989 RepID=B1WNL2_CROS5|nr:ABC transporter ATP-binding protein [Crocosphaera subtropica]ACB51441.1 putative ABC transporter, ATP binding protein [Crocosphaera subtropica ATCC 51142]